MLQLNIHCSWWWAYVPETCRAKYTLIKLHCCIKLAFQIISVQNKVGSALWMKSSVGCRSKSFMLDLKQRTSHFCVKDWTETWNPSTYSNRCAILWTEWFGVIVRSRTHIFIPTACFPRGGSNFSLTSCTCTTTNDVRRNILLHLRGSRTHL